MASITMSVSDEFKEEIKRLAWVNWSELAREETMKKLILENYLATGEITDEEWEFCERVDWHPVDELPVKKEHIDKLRNGKKGRTKKYKSVDELFNSIK